MTTICMNETSESAARVDSGGAMVSQLSYAAVSWFHRLRSSASNTTITPITVTTGSTTTANKTITSLSPSSSSSLENCSIEIGNKRVRFTIFNDTANITSSSSNDDDVSEVESLYHTDGQHITKQQKIHDNIFIQDESSLPALRHYDQQNIEGKIDLNHHRDYKPQLEIISKCL